MEPNKPAEKKSTPNSGRDQRTTASTGYKPRFQPSALTVTSGTKLVPGRPEMLSAWFDSVSEYIEQNFNVHRDIIIKKQYDSDPQEVPPPTNRESAAIVENYKLQLQLYYKKKQELDLSKRKIFAYIWSRLTEESRDRVKRSPTLDDPIDRNDPLKLIKAIQSTHMVADYSGNTAKDKKAARDAYHSIKQSSKESVIDFKNRFLAAVDGMKTAKASVPSDAEMVQDFLEALDKKRFGQLTVDIANGLVAFPASVEAARRLAESRFELNRDATMRNPAAPTRAVQAAFMSTASSDPTSTKQGKKKFPCILCNSTAHRTYQCPFIERARAVVKEEQAHLTTSASDGDGEHPDHQDGDVEDEDEYDPDDGEYDEDYYNPVAGYMVYKATVPKRRFDDFEVLLDNQASSSVVHNADLLWNIRDADTPALFTGYGGTRTVTKVGEIPYFGLAYFDPDAPANLISMSAVEDAFRVDYEQGRTYTVHVSPKRTFVFSRRKNRHYTCNLREFIYELRGKPQFAAVLTSTAMEQLYTKEEVARAREARDFLRRLGYPSLKDGLNVLRYLKADITPQDLHRAVKIYGEDPAVWKGKCKETKARPSEGKNEVTIDLTQTEQIMFADIVTFEGSLYLFTFTSPLGLLVVSLLADKNADTIAQECVKIVDQYKARGFRIVKIQTDPEATFVAAGSRWQELGIVHDTAGVNQHVPEVEVRVRIVKERCRCILNELPYQLPRRLIPHLVMFVVARLNSMPSNIRMDPTPPREIFTNRRIDYVRDLSIGFGDFCIVQDFPEHKSSLEPRAVEAISLCPVANTHGSVLFYVLSSQRIIARDKWQAAPMPPSAVDVMNKTSREQDGTKRRTYKASLLKAMEISDGVPTATFISKASIPRVVRFDDEGEGNDVVRVEQRTVADEGDDHGGDTRPSEPEAIVPAESVTVSETTSDVITGNEEEDVEAESGQDEVDNDDQHVRPPPEPPPTERYNTRYKGQKHPAVYYTGVTNDMYLFQVSFAKACKAFGEEEASKAALSELMQMETKNVWSPMKPEGIRGSVIRSFLFLKEKFDASGNFQKLKARLVAGGNGQDPSLYPDKASPTASVQTIFILATIAAHEGRTVVTADIGSAYLNASMRGTDVFMRLDPSVSRLLVQTNPHKYQEYLRNDGTIVVKLLKALYGCIESAKLWYETLKSSLVDFGFTCNPQDHCVFNKTTSGGQLTVAVYVDDLFITCKSGSEIQGVIQHLRDRFGTLTVNEGTFHSYLGMNFDFACGEGAVRVSMEGFTQDLLQHYGVVGRVVTPATSSLFEVPSDATLLGEKESKDFHSCVAKLMYLAKRTRPDILTAVSFLSTRVSKPTEADNAKLRRVLQYLNGSANMGIILQQTDATVKAYIDASFAVHSDLRSHTGICVTLGKGPIFVASSKQKINTKSSTEAEVVGLSDKLGEVIWIRNFLQNQYANENFTGPAVVYQDNMSAMALIDKGKSMSSTTKHINVRFFFVKDKVRSKEVDIQYVNTKDMIADILTKPLQGRLFRKLRDDLMNDTAVQVRNAGV